MTSLSGTYRVSNIELGTICALRTKRMSINIIAKLLKRSTATVHAYVKPMKIDNRRNPPKSRTKGRNSWLSKLKTLRIKLKLYFLGVYESIQQALDDPMIPQRVLYLASENTIISEALEPP